MQNRILVRIIPSALLRIGEDFVRSLQLGEAAAGVFRVLYILIWMKLKRPSPVSLSNTMLHSQRFGVMSLSEMPTHSSLEAV